MSELSPTPVRPAHKDLGDEEPAEQLRQLWRQGRAPDVHAFLAQAGTRAPAEIVEVLLVDQRQRWQAGQRVLAEAYLGRHPGSSADAEGALDLVYGEFLLREEMGEEPTMEEYARRFPEHAEKLRVQVELHRAIPKEGWPEEDAGEAGPDGRPWPAVPGYEVLGEVGRGGMGVVYKARQLALERVVAIKMILAGAHADPEHLRRFRAEAEAIARLRHPNFVGVYDSGVRGGWPYLVLEFVEGGTLAQKVAGNPQPPREAARAVETLAAAVHHAHRAGLVHRDLKPTNVLLTEDGVLKITDFGLVKRLHADARGAAPGGQTHSGALLGTPAYMAPEQVAAESGTVGPAADVYALGGILYELLTGRPPFQGDSALEVLRQVQEQEPRPPGGLQPGVPRDLETICLKCLQKEPGKRYMTAAALAEDLRRFQAGEPIAARPVGAPERVWRWCRRNPRWAAMLATVAGLLLTIALSTSVLSLLLSAALRGTRDAEVDVKKKLFESQVAEARAQSLNRGPGQRFKSLALLEQANRLARELQLLPEKFDELRLSTLGALVMPDLYPAKEWDGFPAGSMAVDFDDQLEVYARTDEQGNCSVHRVEGDVELHHLPSPGRAAKWHWPCLSRDGRFVAVWHSEGGVQVWKIDQANPEMLLSEDKIYWVDFDPKSRAVAFSHTDGAVTLYDLTTGRRVRQLTPHILTREVRIALHPKESLVAVTSYFAKAVQIRDLRTGAVVKSLDMPRGAHHVAWHPEGRTLAASDGDGPNVHLFDRDTWQRRRTLGTITGGTLLYFNHAGDRLAVYGSWDSSIQLFDVGTARLLIELPYSGARSYLRFSRDDHRLAGFARGARLGIWQVGDGREYCTLVRQPPTPPLSPARGGVEWRAQNASYVSAAVSPDGRLLVAAMTDGVGFWDLDAGAELAFLKADNIRFARFEPDGALLMGDATGTYRWPVHSDTATPGLRCFGPPQPLPLPAGMALAQSHDGRVLATGTRAVSSWQPWAGAWIHHADQPAPLHLNPGADVASIALSPDGRWVVTAELGSDLVRIWDAQTGGLERQLPERGWSPCFSPDGRWLALGGQPGRLLATATWRQERTLALAYPEGPAHFAPDSRTLIVKTGTHVLSLVEAAIGRELTRLEDPNLDVPWEVLFTPDGTRLLTVIKNKGIHVWDLRLLRRQLAERDLDWDPPADQPTSHLSGPLQVDLERGDFDRLRLQQLAENYDRCVREGPNIPIRWYYRGLFHQEAGRYEKALTDLHKAVELQPKAPLFCNSLAWLYVTGPESLRNPNEAVALAERAVELRPGEWTYYTTLGVAYYRTGRFRDAVTALEKSLKEDAGQQEASNLYFLAMTHHRLGEAARARECFTRARGWHDQKSGDLSPTEAKELQGFRAEAEDVLRD